MNILIIRTSAIGDIVLTMPLAESLKRYYQQQDTPCTITWLVQPENKTILEDNPFIDKLIIWDRAELKKLTKNKDFTGFIRHIKAIKTELRQQSFDLCLDAQGLLKSGVLAYLSGAKKKIGLGSKEGSQFFMDTVIAKDLGDTTMICSEYMSLAEHITGSRYFNLSNYSCPRTKKSAQLTIAKALQHSAPKNPQCPSYIVIAPFTTRDEKHWFSDYWVELCAMITSQINIPIIMLGGPGDKEKSLLISEHTQVISLIGQTSLKEAGAIIDDATVLIGVDTGLLHMGQAAKITTLGLFGATDPYLKTPLPNQRILHYPCLCDGNRKAKRSETNGCMRDLTPSIVFENIKDLLDQEKNHQHE